MEKVEKSRERIQQKLLKVAGGIKIRKKEKKREKKRKPVLTGRVGTAGVFEQDNEANLPLIFRTSNYIRASLAFHVTVYYYSPPFWGKRISVPPTFVAGKRSGRITRALCPGGVCLSSERGPLPRQPDGSTRVLWVTPTSN
ncbi:hypothetical protein CDAR_103291 [Caerostris darwini]|uniref:Uncharacterized protein n=1 Tax=Caerostris darwini TaxID=1538125 RepID=A0AAV4V3Y2_9ARAC|nr:hypothetical protein CDAR_103291 [Caerostris darwini]